MDLRFLVKALFTVVVLLGATALAIWTYGPAWIAPAPDFPQGPGGALAFVSLSTQLRTQARQLARGEPVRLTLTEQEFSGVVSSALLSGWRGPGDQPKVRSLLENGLIRQEMVVRFQDPAVPERFRGPVGLRVWLEPRITPGAPARFRIVRGMVGRIPLSAAAIRRLSQASGFQPAGFDPAEPALVLPVESLISENLGRSFSIREFAVTGQKVTLTVALGTR
ncbi:MAG TPA: hypothetical protein VGK74_27065 [Symbiobacteriaceae bacterium]|jgi:hypothetical protein